MPYLIDGHNLIPKLGLRLDSPDDEVELVAVLQEYCRTQRRAAEVYFDGAPAGAARVEKLGAVTAHFIRMGTTADAAIAARLRKMGRAARNWTVISSDRQVQASADAARAGWLSSEEFARQLQRISESPPAVERPPSPEQVEEWLRLFGDQDRKK